MTEHLRMTASYVYLWILRNFSHYLFYRAPLRNCLFHGKLQNFNTGYSKNVVRRFFSSILYQPASLRKKLFRTSSFMFLSSFSQNTSRLLLAKRLWMWASTISGNISRKVGLLVTYLFNYDSSLSQLSLCWIWHLSFSRVQFLSNKLDFFILAI